MSSSFAQGGIPNSPDDTLVQSEEALARARALSRNAPHVPGYELERLLGAGTYGEVWLARDVRTGVRVAIKFFSCTVGNRWEFLQAEIQQLALLHADPGIVRLIDVNAAASPPYYVMDYAEGGSLAQRLEHGPLPAAEAIALFGQLARALAYVHARGIRHCDLKPGNVLLTSRGEPMLADFGQAQLREDVSPALGTFFYMPPEQAQLEASLPDSRWDVYALGALAYHMLVGHPPHDTEQARQRLRQAGTLTERLQVYRQLIAESPPPREHHRVPGVDRQFARIIDRCLEIDPARRYSNAETVLEALAERDRIRSRRPLLLLGGLVPTVLALAIIFFVWQGIWTALEQAERVSIDHALYRGSLVAELAARSVGQELDRRWRILEAVAGDPDFVRLVEQSGELPRDELPLAALQQRVEQLHRAHEVTAQARSWFVTDSRGRQVARSPLQPDTIGKDFSFRDYFHGLGTDLAEPSNQLRPIRHAHRSIVFVSQATHTPMIALSVPVRPEGERDAEPVGVLAMTVEIGHFFGLGNHAGWEQDPERFLALFDCRPDWSGRVGLVLQHPKLASIGRLDQVRADALPRYSGNLVSQVLKDGAVRAAAFRDPLLPGEWLVAIELVRAPRPGSRVDWAVVSAESRAAALRPMAPLRQSLTNRGLLTSLAVGVAVAAIWSLLYRQIRQP